MRIVPRRPFAFKQVDRMVVRDMRDHEIVTEFVRYTYGAVCRHHLIEQLKVVGVVIQDFELLDLVEAASSALEQQGRGQQLKYEALWGAVSGWGPARTQAAFKQAVRTGLLIAPN